MTAQPVSLDANIIDELAVGGASASMSVTSTTLAQIGVLRVGMSAESAHANSQTTRDGIATSNSYVKASWQDKYFVTGNPANPQPGRLMHVHALLNVHGDMDAQAQTNDPYRSSSRAAADCAIFLTGKGDFWQNVLPPSPYANGHYGRRSEDTIDGSVYDPPVGALLVTLTAPEGQLTDLYFEIALSGSATARSDPSWFPFQYSATFDADFTQTISWGGITGVTDAATGDPISGWTVTSESGVDYANPIPEPASLAALALAALFLARPRRC